MADILKNIALSPRKYPIPIFLTLTAAGLAGNYFAYEIFFSIHFIFGSIFAMLALQLFGFRWGVINALIISSMTYLLWNHPYAIVIMTAEVAVVHILRERRGIGLVLADAIYWVFIGIPLVIVFYYGVMQLPFYNAAVTMMKQALNGIFNALLARLVFTVIMHKGRMENFSLREMTFSLLALFVLVPSLLLISLQSRNDLEQTEKDIRTSLRISIQKTVPSVETWIRSNLNNVEYLAWLSTTQSLAMMQHAIARMHDINPDFIRMGIMDKSATSVAYSPLIDEFGKTNLGKNFADRPFIPLLEKTLKPMLSEVVLGRIGTPRPIVSALAPIVRQGVYTGYVIGVWDLERLRQMITTNMKGSSLPDVQFILLDRNSKVIVSSRPELRISEPHSRGRGELVDPEDEISQWIPQAARNVSVSDRWKKALYVTESRIGAASEWTLVLEQPMAPFQKQLYERYATLLSWVFFIMLAALIVAEMASRTFVRSLNAVKAISTDIPDKISSGAEILWPSSSIQETGALIGNFRTMAKALSMQFGSVQRMNAELESRVDKRTQELLDKTEQLEDLTKNLEIKVAAEIAIRTRNEWIMIQQSKMAAMGEILGAIAHQWRQPLNALGLIVQNIRDAHTHGQLDSAGIDMSVEKAMSHVRHMSHTIDDFRHFFQQDKERTVFDTMLAAGNVLSLFSAQLEANDIDFLLTGGAPGSTFYRTEDITACPESAISGFQNEFEHVIFNLISNSREAIIEKRQRGNTPEGERGLISIDFHLYGGKVVIEVGDNGTGIVANVLERIFEPYYTTKDQSKGTGLGLYMSKVIIEDHMQGRLTARNGNSGAIFTIEIPVEKERIKNEQI